MENTVIERIKQFCAKEGLSVSELAKALNVAQRTTNSYINEGRTPSFEFIEKLVSTFELDANWVVSGKGDMYHTNIVKGDNQGVVSNTGTVGNVGGNHVSIGDSSNIKKIMNEEGVSIEFAQSVDSLQQTNAHLEIRIKDLETINASQSKTIETMQLLIDTLTKK